MSLPLWSCCISGLGPEGIWHNRTIPVWSPGNLLRVTLASRGNSASKTSDENLNGQSAVSMGLPLLQHPLEKQVTSLQELHSTRDFLQMHLQEPDFFWFMSNAFLKRPILLNIPLLRPFSKGKPHAKAVSSKDYFTHLRTLKNARKGRWVIGPDYQASHPRRFCAIGDDVTQRYYVPWDLLWDACHMAGVRWGSRCKGFCSEEGPHYCF